MIYFRDRKYGGQINTSFFVKNGSEIDDLSRFQVGDKVLILFRLTPVQAQAIEERSDHSITRSLSGALEDVLIPFRVAERSHGMAARGGDLCLVSGSVGLEAETGVGEDILRWVCCGERPAWVEEE